MCKEEARFLTAKTWRADIFPVRSRARLRVNVYTEFIVTIHNFNQFEKVEWSKLVRAEMEARKYMLGQQGKSPSNRAANRTLSARMA